MIQGLLREAGPEYFAGVLVLLTGAATSAIARMWKRRRAATTERPVVPRADENP
ncbi:hypothetical protein [Streptomyces sp. NPDC050600]|uniref:hypothetical protein n=1 Tax=Streptomyces sp. NPDC050600 TaxID=3157213 RepID=UPI0034240DA9